MLNLVSSIVKPDISKQVLWRGLHNSIASGHATTTEASTHGKTFVIVQRSMKTTERFPSQNFHYVVTFIVIIIMSINWTWIPNIVQHKSLKLLHTMNAGSAWTLICNPQINYGLNWTQFWKMGILKHWKLVFSCWSL